MILETAGLSFLGLGAQPPQADLGGMLGDGRNLIQVAPHVATIPGLVILLLAIGINLVGDGLRDVLDPKLKSGRRRRAPMPAPRRRRARRGGRPRAAGGRGPPAACACAACDTPFHASAAQVYRAVGGVDFTVAPGAGGRHRRRIRVRARR